MERSRAARLARAERREVLQSQLAQSFDAMDHPRSNPSEERSLGRRRAVPAWESEDDDDLADSEEMGYRRHSQMFGDQDEERALAALRGSIAAAKKIPSKEALAALERVDLKDLKESDKGEFIRVEMASLLSSLLLDLAWLVMIRLLTTPSLHDLL